MNHFRIDKFGAEEKKESIFRLEARECERVSIRAAAEKAERDQTEADQGNYSGVRQVFHTLLLLRKCRS